MNVPFNDEFVINQQCSNHTLKGISTLKAAILRSKLSMPNLTRGSIKIHEALEVLKVVEESWTLKTVCGSTGILNTIGHAWGATGEDTDVRQKDILFLKVVKEGIEVRTTKVGYRA